MRSGTRHSALAAAFIAGAVFLIFDFSAFGANGTAGNTPTGEHVPDMVLKCSNDLTVSNPDGAKYAIDLQAVRKDATYTQVIINGASCPNAVMRPKGFEVINGRALGWFAFPGKDGKALISLYLPGGAAPYSENVKADYVTPLGTVQIPVVCQLSKASSTDTPKPHTNGSDKKLVTPPYMEKETEQPAPAGNGGSMNNGSKGD